MAGYLQFEYTVIVMTDLELLARIIKCEAGGEGDDGMKAVATVVLNRVNANVGEYGGTNRLRDVIYQSGQFDCAREYIRGAYNPQNIYNTAPEQIHYDIASWALGGGKFWPVGNALWYYNPFSPQCRSYFPNQNGILTNRVGDHCFYDPTELYYST